MTRTCGPALVLTAVVSDAALAGLSWTVSAVVYPAFRRVPAEAWAAYHEQHSSGMARLILVPWAAEAAAAIGLVLLRPPGVPRGIALAHAGCVGSTAALTALGAVPLHQRLGAGPKPTAVAALLRVHAWRTAAWSAASALSVEILRRCIAGNTTRG